MVEAAACLAAGKCVVMTKTIFQISIATYIIAGLLLIILFLIMFWTPAGIFLTAKLKKRPVFYVANRSQGARFAVGKPTYEGTAEVAGSGTYNLTENSHTIERKSGLPLYIAFGEFAGTVPLKWISVISTLKEKYAETDKPINNVEDLGKKIGLKFDSTQQKWVAEITAETVKSGDNKVEIKPFSTIRMIDLVNMFPFNYTPAMIESKIAHIIAAKQKFWNSLNPQAMFMIIVLLVGASIAAVILWKFMGGGQPEVIVNLPPGLQTIATSGNFTG